MQPVYHLVYLVFPKPDHPKYGALDGAFASCWVKEPRIERADHTARSFLEESRWDIEKPGEVQEVTTESCPLGAEGRDHFEQANTEGMVCVLYAWPPSV
ncbi:MAG: hypothetical protein ABI613_07640 [Gemmatimonadota bacterium]